MTLLERVQRAVDRAALQTGGQALVALVALSEQLDLEIKSEEFRTDIRDTLRETLLKDIKGKGK